MDNFLSLQSIISSHCDVVVVGAGAAGLMTCLELPSNLKILLLNRNTSNHSSSRWAQGGIAAVTGPQDSIQSHKEDTLNAGAGFIVVISGQIMIEGNVFDANSKPINNVNIYSNISGTSTNQDGYFKLSLDEEDIVNISHIKFRDVRYIAKDIPSKIILHHSFISTNQIVVNSNLTDKNLSQTVKGTTVIDPQSNESLNDFSDYVNSIPNVSMIPGTSKGR